MMRHDKKIKRCLMELSKKPARNRNSNNIQIWKYNSKRLGQLRKSLVTRPFWVLLNMVHATKTQSEVIHLTRYPMAKTYTWLISHKNPIIPTKKIPPPFSINIHAKLRRKL